MAWLSQGLGYLAELGDFIDGEERAASARCAELLGYPHRLPRHLERDEYWFWMDGDAGGESPTTAGPG